MKRGRGRAKKVIAASDEPEEVEQPIEKPVKKGRGRAASTQKAAEEAVEPAKEEPAPAKKRGAKKKDEEVEQASEQPVEPAKPARGRSRTQRTRTEQADSELPPAQSKPTRTKKASVSRDDEQQVEPEPEKAKRGRKAASSKAESVTRDETEKPAAGRGKRAASKASKQAEEAKEDDQIVEQEQPKRSRAKSKAKSAEEVELPAQPEPRKGRGKAKKDEVVQVEAKSTAAGKRSKKKTTEEETPTVEEPIAAASSDDKVSKSSDLSVIVEKPNEAAVQDEEDEDDNKSEKELVIDLKDDLPAPPKKRGRKAKTVTEVPAASQETAAVSSQASQAVTSEPVTDSQPEPPAAKRGRTKKQPPKATDKPATEAEPEPPAKRGKRKAPVSDDDKVPSKDLESEQQPVASLSTEEGEEPAIVERPSKRHETEEKETEEKEIEEKEIEEKEIEEKEIEEKEIEESAEEEMQIDTPVSEKQPSVGQEESNVEETSGEERVQEEVQPDVEEEKEQQKELEADESASSQFDADKVKTDVHTMLDDIKSLVEISTRDQKSVDSTIDDASSTSLNETGEVISAKELEEYTSDDDGLRITYNSIINVNETRATSELPSTSNTPSFTISESEPNARKRIKLFSAEKELELPNISGKLITFGRDLCGELGRLEVGNDRHRPGQLKVNESESFCAVSSQSQHSVCISTAGHLYTFGNNDESALGRLTNGDDVQCATPTMVNGTLSMYRFCKATAGESHTAALTNTGTVFYWGNFRDSNGSVGLTADIRTPTIKPVVLDESLDIVSIASGANFLLLLDSYGVVHSLGIGERGELGRFADEESCKFDNKQFDRAQRARFLEPQPLQFPKNAKIDAIWCGEYAGFARSADDGRVFAWGLNNYNQLGIGRPDGENELCVYEPREISYFSKIGVRIEKIAGNQHHTLMLDDKGRVYACGRHEYGRLGLGRITEDPAQPTLIDSLPGQIVDIACSVTASYAVSARGELYSWGGSSPELGLGEEANEQDYWEPTLIKSKLMSRFQCLRVTAGSSHCLLLGQFTGPNAEDVNNNKRNGML